MKTLLLVRHAKSSWKDASLADIDRPLNRRGIANAPEMGERLFARKLIPDFVLSSPAVRAHTTAAAIATQVGYPPGRIEIADELYGGVPQDVLEIVSRFDETVTTAMVVIHNPTITELANTIFADPVDNVPTCGILTVSTPTWKEISSSATGIDFDYPKRVHD